jgi:hypothetical protein
MGVGERHMETCEIGERGACMGGLAWYGDCGLTEAPRHVYGVEDFGDVCADGGEE